MDPNAKKVLIIEDDDDMRHSLADGLGELDFQIFQAAEGEAGLGLTLDQQPDLIVLDLLLPKLDGYKILERIRHYPDPGIAATKVVILSNLWSDKDILRAQALQIDEYFVKANTKLDEVFGKVRQLLVPQDGGR